jgi:endonuclease YncB( thermonuclease family)
MFTGLEDALAAAIARLIPADMPSEVGLFIAGIGLILLVPTFAHRLRGGPRSSGTHDLRPDGVWARPRWTDRPAARSSKRSPNTAPRSSPTFSSPITGRVRVVDGDTVVIRGHRVRLHGIDAPEMDQRGGEAARRYLGALVAGRPVTAIPIDVDIHGRTVARLEVEGTDLCRAMVADGFAIAYRKFSTAYAADERAARAARRGLWARCALTGIESPAAHRYKTKSLPDTGSPPGRRPSWKG